MELAQLMEEVRKELAVIRGDLTQLKVSDARQSVVLESVRVDLNDHMRRTAQLEHFTSKWAFTWTLLGGCATLLGALATVLKLMGRI